MTYVGQVYVRVSPDTKQFDAAIARREKKRRKTVFEALLDTAEAEARRKVLERPATFKLEVEANTKEIAEAQERITTLKESMDEFNRKDVELEIKAETDKIEDLSKEIARIEAMTREEYRVELDTRIDKATGNIADVKQRIQDLKVQSKINIRAEVVEARAKIEKMRESLVEMQREADVPVRLEIAKAQANISQLKAELRRVKDGAKKIKLEADLSEAMTDLVAWQNKAGATITPEIQAQMDGIAEAEKALQTLARDRRIEVGAKLSIEEASLAEYRTELKKLTADREITLDLDVDAANARRQLATVARDRTVNLYVNVFGLKKASDALKGLSGAGMVSRFRDSMYKIFASLDMVAIKLATVAPAVAHLGSLLISAVPAIAAFGEGFGMIVPALLPAAAGIGALSATVVVAAMAFRDLEDSSVESAQSFYQAWSNAADQMKGVKEAVQQSFFTPATTESFNRLMGETIPQLKTGFEGLAAAMGATFTAVLDQLYVGLSNGVLENFLGSVETAFRNSAQGLVAITQGLINLSVIGSRYLPDFGGWVNEIGDRFYEWSMDTDKVAEAIETANEQLGFLRDGIGGFFGSFGAILDATGAATNGFQGFSEAMMTLEAFLRTSEIQSGLSGLFGGATAGLSGLSAHMGTMKEEIGIALRGVGIVLEAFGGAFKSLVDGIITVLATPEVSSSLKTLGDSIKAALDSIDWESVGVAIASIAGAFATVMPLFADLFNALVDLIPPITKVATGIAEAFLPIVTAIAPALPVLAVLGGAIAGVLATMTKLSPLVEIFGGWPKVFGAVAKAVGPLPGLFTKLLSSVRLLSAAVLGSPITWVVIAIAAIVAILIHLWKTNDNFRNAVIAAWDSIKAAVAVVVMWFKENLLPVLTPIWEGIEAGFSWLVQALGDGLAVSLGQFTEFVNWVTEVALPALLGFLTRLIEGWKTGFETVKQFFTDLGDKIAAFVEGVKTGFEAVKQFFTDLGDKIAAFVEDVKGFFETLGGIWDTFMGKNKDLATSTETSWASMEDSVSGHSSAMSLTAEANMADMSGRVAGELQGMSLTSNGILTGWASDAGQSGTAAGGGIVEGLGDGLARALDRLESFAGAIGTATSGWWAQGFSSGSALGQGLVEGMESWLQRATLAGMGLAAAAASALPNSPAKIGAFSGRGWTPYRGKAIVDGLTKGMLASAPKLVEASRVIAQQSSDALNLSGVDATWPGMVATQAGSGMAGMAPLNITVSPILDPAKSMQSQTERSMEAAFEAANRRLSYA